ncbi:MAG TPA: bifunctional phosphoribosyl-AMP cyclohydrolase/phosphoribosyl-ATP diphosphatase HisIE [Holophagaceae bacterium]|nr:bifunctional phosphoribosyl-AMP cyclohydrolase/phosphoribosyl-ATP diphosphatase HisIE [Holophagaceae bacterium]
MDLETLKFDADGLIPGVVQDPMGELRMVGWLNRESLARTLETGFVTFWSRSRRTLWTKGETSGHRLRLLEIRADCDSDTLRILAAAEGPTCHRGTLTCFDGDPHPATLPWLGRLEALLRLKQEAANPEGSYTQKLFAKGTDRIAKKVVEEAGEVVIAAKTLQASGSGPDRAEFLGEAADLLFHLELLLLDRGCSLLEVVDVLKRRHEER